jgi:isochorismate hydrolase
MSTLSRKTHFSVSTVVLIGIAVLGLVPSSFAGDDGAEEKTRVYRNALTKLDNPDPLLNDHPEFVQPVIEQTRYEAPLLVDQPDADLSVRAWRFSYNARGIIEMPNRLRADQTAVIMVHPWGIDDGQGWTTPEPAGVADFCTPTKNQLAEKHVRDVVNPLLKRLRPHVAFTMYSLRDKQYPVHKKLYRSMRYNPTVSERAEAKKEISRILNSFNYTGADLPAEITLSANNTVKDYFKQFPGLDAGDSYNNAGFWKMPIPVCAAVEMAHDDIVIYDADGYGELRDFLKQNEVANVILVGYATDMCFCKTTAGYENLSQDFNVFLVGDATLATFPANETPAYATNAHISFASLNQLVTQCSWIKTIED